MRASQADTEQTGGQSVPLRTPAIECRGAGIWFYINRKRKVRLRDYVVRRRVDSDTFWALRNIDLTVHRGESVGIIGSNGSGKSTLLKLIAGVLYPDEGEVIVHGGVAPLIELGAGFSGELSAKENLYLSGMIMGMSEDEIDAKYSDIVKLAGLKGFMDTPLKHFSSGMKGRLGFAIVAQVESDIMLLDEVLAVGDRRFRKKANAILEDKLTKQGRTLVLVSHRERELRTYCERTVWLHKGAVKAEGPTDEVLEMYGEYQDGTEDE